MNSQPLKKGLVLSVFVPDNVYKHVAEVVPGELTAHDNITASVYIDTDAATEALFSLITKAITDYNDGIRFEKQINH